MRRSRIVCVIGGVRVVVRARRLRLARRSRRQHPWYCRGAFPTNRRMSDYDIEHAVMVVNERRDRPALASCPLSADDPREWASEDEVVVEWEDGPTLDDYSGPPAERHRLRMLRCFVGRVDLEQVARAVR